MWNKVGWLYTTDGDDVVDHNLADNQYNVKKVWSILLHMKPPTFTFFFGGDVYMFFGGLDYNMMHFIHKKWFLAWSS